MKILKIENFNINNGIIFANINKKYLLVHHLVFVFNCNFENLFDLTEFNIEIYE